MSLYDKSTEFWILLNIYSKVLKKRAAKLISILNMAYLVPHNIPKKNLLMKLILMDLLAYTFIWHLDMVPV